MLASSYGYFDVVRTLLEGGADVNAQDRVRNQMMITMMMIVINDEDRDVGR
jgi:ankyrin repeat protein